MHAQHLWPCNGKHVRPAAELTGCNTAWAISHTSGPVVGAYRCSCASSRPHQGPSWVPQAAADVDGGVLSADTLRISSKSQVILDKYRSVIHEYRTHKEAINAWLQLFLKQHKRPPGLLDAEATQDVALISRFQQYLMMRKRLMVELPYLRQEVSEAQASDGHSPTAAASAAHRRGRPGSSGSHSSSSSSFGVINANAASPRTPGQASAQFFSALNYRRSQPLRPSAEGQAAAGTQPAAAAAMPAIQPAAAAAAASALPGLAAGAGSSSGAAGVAGGASGAAAEGVFTTAKVAGPRGPAAAPPPLAPSPAAAAAAAMAAPAAAVSGGKEGGSAAGGGAGGPHQQQQQLDHLVGASSGSSAASGGRVTSAAMAALEYKKQKAQGKAQPAAVRVASTQVAALQAPVPPPPPSYHPPPTAAAAAVGSGPVGAGQQEEQTEVVGVVERARFDVYAGRKQRVLEEDTRMDKILDGVRGGLGAVEPLTSPGPAASSSSSSSTGGLASPSAAAAANSRSRSRSSNSVAGADSSSSSSSSSSGMSYGQGVAVVMTAKYDVYSGRKKRVADDAALDEYLAGLAEASTALAVEQGLIASQPAGAPGNSAGQAIAVSSSSQTQGATGAPAAATAGVRGGGEAENQMVGDEAKPAAVAAHQQQAKGKGPRTHHQQQAEQKGKQQQDPMPEVILTGDAVPMPT